MPDNEQCLIYKAAALRVAQALKDKVAAHVNALTAALTAATTNRDWWVTNAPDSACAREYATLVTELTASLGQANQLGQSMENLWQTINAIDCSSPTYAADIAAAQAEVVASTAREEAMSAQVNTLAAIAEALTDATCRPPRATPSTSPPAGVIWGSNTELVRAAAVAEETIS